jgi:hypothetical protein
MAEEALTIEECYELWTALARGCDLEWEGDQRFLGVGRKEGC